jgi:sugar phosphate isomerase/epimerase
VFRLAYNTNGLAHHRIVEALELLADFGYEGASITPDVGELDLYRPDRALLSDVRACAEERGLALTVETGARFLLDPRRKHHPTLLDADPAQRAKRVDMLCRSIDLCGDLGAELVSLWSGAAPKSSNESEVHGDLPQEIGPQVDTRDTASAGVDPRMDSRASARAGGDRHVTSRTDPALESLWDRLCTGLAIVIDHADSSGVRVAFEPEPGMFIERPSGFAELVARLGARGRRLGLCLDVGHLLVTRDLPVERVVRAHAREIVHVHLDDIRDGVHEHLMFGRGNLDLRAVLRSLIDVGYTGLAAVELSRDSHRGAQAAEEALSHLRRALVDTT